MNWKRGFHRLAWVCSGAVSLLFIAAIPWNQIPNDSWFRVKKDAKEEHTLSPVPPPQGKDTSPQQGGGSTKNPLGLKKGPLRPGPSGEGVPEGVVGNQPQKDVLELFGYKGQPEEASAVAWWAPIVVFLACFALAALTFHLLVFIGAWVVRGFSSG